jgi:hypothetical protein
VLGAKNREQTPSRPSGRGLRQIDLDPFLGAADICPPAVAAHMKMEEGLTVKVERATASVLYSGPRPDLGEHLLEVAEAGEVDAAHALLLRPLRSDS